MQPIRFVAAQAFRPSMLALAVALVSPQLMARGVVESSAAGFGSIMPEGMAKALVDINGNQTLVTVINGVTHTVYSSDAPDSYGVINGGVLNVLANSVVDSLDIDNSTLNVDSSTVRQGVDIHSGEAWIKGSTIRSETGIALRLFLTATDLITPARVHLEDSLVTGLGFGIAVATTGELWLANSVVEGVGDLAGQEGNAGIKLIGGVAHIVNGSRVNGRDSGIQIFNGSHGFR